MRSCFTYPRPSLDHTSSLRLQRRGLGAEHLERQLDASERRADLHDAPHLRERLACDRDALGKCVLLALVVRRAHAIATARGTVTRADATRGLISEPAFRSVGPAPRGPLGPAAARGFVRLAKAAQSYGFTRS